MAKTEPRDNLLRPARPSPQTKADITTIKAREIIQAEADRREDKTQRLRQARLEMEARRPEPAPAKRRPATGSKSAAPRRAR